MTEDGSINWEPRTDGITLSWSDLSVYANTVSRSFFGSGTKTHKRIINNATGVVKAGTLVALMGPR